MLDRLQTTPGTEQITIAKAKIRLESFKSKSGLVFRLVGDRIFVDSGDRQYDQAVGGIGITGRSVKRLEEEMFPGLLHRINQETGKVVFLGNGFSDYPVYLADRFKKGLLKEKPVIIDLFDYELLLQDLEELKSRFLSEGINFPLERKLLAIEAILEDIKNGNLVCLKYKVGSGDVPVKATDAALAINILGPSSLTAEEQLKLLKSGGEIYSIPALNMETLNGFTRTLSRGGSGSIVKKL